MRANAAGQMVPPAAQAKPPAPPGDTNHSPKRPVHGN